MLWSIISGYGFLLMSVMDLKLDERLVSENNIFITAAAVDYDKESFI